MIDEIIFILSGFIIVIIGLRDEMKVKQSILIVMKTLTKQYTIVLKNKVRIAVFIAMVKKLVNKGWNRVN
jgi:CRISPR/Cas system CMR-associated protein Cmr3 (group 5 of RAMP superfamily)|tara:strand:- start:269 stop:478 length:210 start_codon:yes stop_codon:yes gene_type:complete